MKFKSLYLSSGPRDQSPPIQKCDQKLEVALQSWFNKRKSDMNLDVLNVQDNGMVKIKIKPALALSDLQELCGQTLTFRDKKNVTILRVILSPPELETQITEYTSEPQNGAGQLLEQPNEMTTNISPQRETQSAEDPPNTAPSSSGSKSQDEQPVEQSRTNGPTAISTTGEEINTGILPVSQFMYMNNVYKKEIENIEKKNGVKMTADARVTFSAVKETGSPSDALYEFTNLVQKVEYVASHLTLKNRNPKELMDTLQIVLKKESKLMLTLSSEEMVTCGPELKRKPSYYTCYPDAPATGDYKEEKCPICMDTFTKKTQLKCKHEFCWECLESSKECMGPVCPVCKYVFGKVEGDQPPGMMRWSSYTGALPGFPYCGHIVITYHIPGGRQTEKHPNPGKQYYGIERMAYLPDNKEGKEVVRLLKKAFDQKLIFTVGTSRTTGAENQVIWNDIHHKTSKTGGTTGFGYPDPDYLSRVKEELKAKGVE